MKGLRLALLGFCVAAALAAGAAASGHSTRLQLGLAGDARDFRQLTGQNSRVRLITIGWNQGGGNQRYFASLFSTMLDVPLLGIGIPNGSGLTPAAIAQGEGDAFLVALNRAVVTWERPIYVRPLAEMNGAWESYSAFNRDGTSRGPAYSTAMFRQAFARIYLIVHGDLDANAKLARMGLPPVQGTLSPAGNVQVIWNPQGFGAPKHAYNSPAAYFPGNAFVDVVGDDLYDIGHRAAWAAARALYRAHPTKPFAFPEWGLWGIDDPAFVKKMGSFLRHHRRTVLASYFNTVHGSIWDMSSKPLSRAAYRRYLAPLAP